MCFLQQASKLENYMIQAILFFKKFTKRQNPLFLDWLVAIDDYQYEMYLNNFDEHPEKKFIIDICIPVKPA